MATFTICDRCGGECGYDPETGVDVCEECGVVEGNTHQEDEEGNLIDEETE